MTPPEFLDALSMTSFGSVTCINLYRSISAGTIPSTSVPSFVTDCLVAWNAAAPPASSAETHDLALRCVKDWGARASSSKNHRYAIAASTVKASQLSTVINYKTLVSNARRAVHRTYSARRHCSADDLNAVIAEWTTDTVHWTFGKDRDFFWLSPIIDLSMFPSSRLSSGIAQIYRDFLGLCHWGAHDYLIRVAIPASTPPSALTWFRPSAFDGLDNPAFRAACDGETKMTALPHGRTADIAHVQAHATNIDGAIEWICMPLELRADSVVWDYLGRPKLPQCSTEVDFHDSMLAALAITTPMNVVLPFLKAAL
jgi:hypothetical protein